MIGTKQMRLSIVYEYADRPGHMMHSLLENLRPMMPGVQVTYIRGLFPTYRPGDTAGSSRQSRMGLPGCGGSSYISSPGRRARAVGAAGNPTLDSGLGLVWTRSGALLAHGLPS